MVVRRVWAEPVQAQVQALPAAREAPLVRVVARAAVLLAAPAGARAAVLAEAAANNELRFRILADLTEALP